MAKGRAFDPRAEIIDRVTKLVKNDFDGNFRDAFDAYDSDDDGAINWDELTSLFQDAGVSPKWMLKLYVRATFKELDKDGNGKISYAEFEASFKPEKRS